MATLPQHVRDEHQELRARIEVLRTVADSLGSAPIESIREGVGQAYTFLIHQLIPHAQAEEQVWYPTVGRLLRAGEATDTMSRDHLEVIRLTEELEALRLHLFYAPLSVSDEQALRRVLYGLYAIIKLHLAKEEEIYIPLLEARLPAEEVDRLVEAMQRTVSSELPGCKEVRPDLAEVPSQVLQDVVKRVDLAFDAFFRRLEDGETPGYPRFKSRFRYRSLTFKQYGNSFNVLDGGKKNRGTLVLAKLGHVKMVMHRAIKGKPKTAVVKRSSTGKWFVSISVELSKREVQEKSLPVSKHERIANRCPCLCGSTNAPNVV